MRAALAEAITAICREAGVTDDASVESSRGLSGGCISQAAVIRLHGGGEVFAKWNRGAMEEAFRREAESLRDLGAPDALKVPTVIGVGRTSDASHAILVLEYLDTGPKPPDFDVVLGHQLATLHRAATGAQFGYRFDNVLGSTPQPNPGSGNWIEFFREQRLEFQLQLASQGGILSERMRRWGRRLSERLDRFLLPDPPPTLIHGDLWSGNILSTRDGAPAIIDPAAYYADREAELGMIEWMGGCHESFWRAYDESYPLADGWRERVAIYRLYHELNHLNLFGAGYAGAVEATLRELVG